MIEYDQQDSFAKAGYEPIQTNSSYEGGLVREVGKLSFSRVFLAGHSTGGYQPQTVAQIFYRAMFGKDVATGQIDLDDKDDYATSGTKDIRGIKHDAPEPVDNMCYVHYPRSSCTQEQLKALSDGSADTKDFLVTSPEGTKNETADLEKSGDDGGSGNGGGNGSGGDGDDDGDGDSEEGGDDSEDGDDDGGALSLAAITTSTVLILATALFVAW